jgi:sRNA-binding carbon storage regulator CsrA
VNLLIDNWIEEIKVLSEIAKTEPHSAYSAFIHGLQHSYTYFTRTIKDISIQLIRLDEHIDKFIKCLFNGYECNGVERGIFAMPTQMGGLGILVPSKISDTQYENSTNITRSLANHVIGQKITIEVDQIAQNKIKLEIKNNKRKHIKEEYDQIKAELSVQNLSLFEAASEQGASSWLQALPLKLHDFYLDKQSFFDSVYIRY